MNVNIQHMRACLIATGSPETENWRVLWARLCANPTHPQRLAIERQFGRVFPAPVRDEWLLKDLCAVTSMSPSDKRLERQIEVVRSWKEFGLHVVSVNTPGEIATLRGMFPEVEFVASECDASLFVRKTQSIKRMVDIGRTVAKSVLLINSDIETIGSNAIVNRCVVEQRGMVGIRHNYDDEIGAAICELWGIDVFLVPPQVEVPELGFVIGRPMWDYWMCWLLENSEPKMEWVGAPLFFHKNHELNWTTSEWTLGSDAFIAHYGVDIDWERWRRDRPFGVNHQRRLARLASANVEGDVSTAGG